MKRNILSHPWRWVTIIVSILISFGNLLVVSGVFAQLPYMAGSGFWTVWGFKNLAVIMCMAIPVLLGMGMTNTYVKTRWAGIFLLAIWGGLAGFQFLFPSSPFSTSGSLYLIHNIGSSLLCYLGLLLFGPSLINFFERFSFRTWRQILGILVGGYCLTYVTIGTSWLGSHAGQSIPVYLTLFTIGWWLVSDPLWTQIRLRYLVMGTGGLLLITPIVSWMNTNVVHYDPHHGLTTTTHYLNGINAGQPLILLSGIVLLLLLSHLLHRPTNLNERDWALLGMNFIWLINPRPIRHLLTLVMAIPTRLPLWLSCLILLGAALVTTLIWSGILAGIHTLLSHHDFPVIPWRQWGRRVTYQAWRTWLFVGLTWLITVISIWHLWDWRLNMLQWVILHRELILFINVLMVYALFAILMGIFNRFWWAATTSLAIYIVWLVANIIKISDRNEPVLPADTSMVASWDAIRDLFKLVSPTVIVITIIGLVLMNLVAWWLQRQDYSLRWPTPYRVIMILLAVSFLSSFRLANHPDSIAAKSLNNAGDRPYFYSQLRAAKLNGTLLQFANNIDVTVMKQPTGYSKQTMDQLAQRYQTTAKQLNAHRRYESMANQTVIFVLSESFADPKDVPNLTVNGGDPLPYLHELQQTTTSGKMISSGYGGGTANMEYQALTGLSLTNFSPTLPTPFSQLVPYQKQVFAISDLFNYRVAIHPFTANLYNRKQVYQKLGFNKFFHLQGGNQLSYTGKIQHSPYISDAAAYQQTLKQVANHSGGQFINLVTMQNHMPFDHYYDHNDYSVTGTAYLDATHKKNIENYIQGIHYTDTALKQFNEQLDAIHKPVTVVWYGDHLPGIYNGDSMAKDGLALHETDYLVYGNRYSPGHNVQLPRHRIVAPNDFAAMILAQMSVKISPYYALLTKVYEDLPAMALNSFDGAQNNTANGSSEMVDENGQLVTRLTNSQKGLLHDYQLVQYDLTAGKGYLAQPSFMSR